MKINKILVPVDYSEFSDQAVEYAIQLGVKFGAAIEIIHVITLFQDDLNQEEWLSNYEDRALKLVQRLKNGQENVPAISSELLRGTTAGDRILEYLAAKPFDLVVMGTHGRSGVRHMLYGSVAERVVRLSSVPVLTVHHSIKKFKLRNILVPIDFSEYSKKAVSYVLEFNKSFEVPVTFLHVIEQSLHPAFYAGNFESIFEIDPKLKERALSHLRDFVGEVPFPAHFKIAEGRAHEEIVKFARDDKMDLILMATRGLSGLENILLGSTTERVVRYADCPVLSVARD